MRQFNRLVVCGEELEKVLNVDLDGDGKVSYLSPE
jgi:hypothetical protein